jgi:hypothetical protein
VLVGNQRPERSDRSRMPQHVMCDEAPGAGQLLDCSARSTLPRPRPRPPPAPPHGRLEERAAQATSLTPRRPARSRRSLTAGRGRQAPFATARRITFHVPWHGRAAPGTTSAREDGTASALPGACLSSSGPERRSAWHSRPTSATSGQAVRGSQSTERGGAASRQHVSKCGLNGGNGGTGRKAPGVEVRRTGSPEERLRMTWHERHRACARDKSRAQKKWCTCRFC